MLQQKAHIKSKIVCFLQLKTKEKNLIEYLHLIDQFKIKYS